jgi:hypothetical protein
MADAALFMGWGQVVRGREKRAVQAAKATNNALTASTSSRDIAYSDS